ncbi:MAG: translation factor Sua5, partial [Gemmatimonadetes bacterium]|nr:translation factor Sua5 [Gemmatimonadota bacterium]
PCQVGIESTVLDLTQDPPAILRPGMLDARQLAALLGAPVLERSATVAAHEGPAGAAPLAPLAPGQADKHYAPRAVVWLMDPDRVDEVAAALAARPAGSGVATALLRTLSAAQGFDGARVEQLPGDPAGFARSLYAALHAADAAGSTVIVIERPPDTPEWQGVRDRLARAAR